MLVVLFSVVFHCAPLQLLSLCSYTSTSVSSLLLSLCSYTSTSVVCVSFSVFVYFHVRVKSIISYVELPREGRLKVF